MQIQQNFGQVFNINNENYVLVKGDKCADCVLHNKPECGLVANCETHNGHYEKYVEESYTNKYSILAEFCEKIAKQKDCPTEFKEIVNQEFWNLI